MNSDNMNISKIESYINSIFDNKISKNTFFGSYPEKETVKPEWNDMVFIEIPNGIEDRDAYGEGTILVWLFARPLPNGNKCVSKLYEMEKSLNSVIQNANDHDYRISRRGVYTDYDSDLKWHANVVEVVLKIF